MNSYKLLRGSCRFQGSNLPLTFDRLYTGSGRLGTLDRKVSAEILTVPRMLVEVVRHKHGGQDRHVCLQM
jgi:hypothetical protein